MDEYVKWAHVTQRSGRRAKSDARIDDWNHSQSRLDEPVLPSAVQAIAGGALGSCAAAVARVANRASGSVAEGRTIAAIAGTVVACSGGAVREST